MKPAIAYGALRGVLRPDGTLLTTFAQVVRCDLDAATLRATQGRIVEVAGLVERDPVTWHPVAVRATGVTVIPPAVPDAYRRARGVLPWVPGDLPAEALVRALRDEAG